MCLWRVEALVLVGNLPRGRPPARAEHRRERPKGVNRRAQELRKKRSENEVSSKKEIKGQNLLNRIHLNTFMSTTVEVNRDAIMDLIKVKDQFDTIVESIELMMNKEFMDSYKRSKQQIKNR